MAAGRCAPGDDVAHRYLHLPVRTGGEAADEASVEGRSSASSRSSWPRASPISGCSPTWNRSRQDAAIEVDRWPGLAGLAAITQGDDVPDADSLSRGTARSSTSRRGAAGTTTPTAWSGRRRVAPLLPAQPLRLELGQHALGPRGQHRPGPLEGTAHALYPREVRRLGFSGSAVVDAHNTSGLQDGSEPPLVVAFTSTGRGECIAYSNDRGAPGRSTRATRSSSTPAATRSSSGTSPASTGSWPSTTRPAGSSASPSTPRRT